MLLGLTGGQDNPELKATITHEINCLADIMPTQPERIRSLRGWVEILFNLGKQARYGGAATVKAHLRGDCASIRLISDQIESACKSEDAKP